MSIATIIDEIADAAMLTRQISEKFTDRRVALSATLRDLNALCIAVQLNWPDADTRTAAVNLAVTVIRYIDECHDDGGTPA